MIIIDIIKILDEISELVYISDMETYDLLYINKAVKERFRRDFHGKKCYEYLQGRECPCEFCTNSIIDADSVYTWEFQNPIIGRHAILKDTVIEYEGRPARLEIALDITDEEKQIKMLENALLNERAALSCVHALYDSEDTSDAIEYILETIGDNYLADRTYIFEIRGDKMSNTYEWCNEGVEPEIDKLQNLDVTVIDHWMEAFHNNEPYVIRDLEEHKDEHPEEYDILKQQNIRSLIVAPIISSGEITGYLGVDNPIPEKLNDTSLINTLVIYFGIAMDKIHTNRQLMYLSYYDKLTGLYNRNKYMKDLKDISGSKVRNTGIVYLDINSLKSTNDIWGHRRGDQLLVEATGLMKEAFSDQELYRIGGDEFLVWWKDCSEEDLISRVNRLKNLFLHSAMVSASIGYAWSASLCDIQNLISIADERMYYEKKNFYRKNPQGARYRSVADDLLNLCDHDNLKDAFENNRFILYFQPKFSFATNEISGCEALCRYRDPNGNIITPDQFIPALESAKLMKYIDYFGFACVCRLLKEWLEKGFDVVPVSINFSRYTLSEDNFMDTLINIWEQYRVPKDLLEIEVIESVENIDSDYLIEILRNLKENGFSISIDDFGVKYANLVLFTNADVHTLKLDRSLILDLEMNKKSQLMIESLVHICRNFDIQVVVEGVETERQFDILKEIGCDAAQGFWFSVPIPEDTFVERYLSERKCNEGK